MAGHDDVRRRFTGQLDDVFAHVRLKSLDPSGFHGVVKADLLTDHGLALDDAFGMHPLGNLQGDSVGLLGVLGPVHLHPIGAEIGFQLLQQTRQVRQAVTPDRRP